MQVGFSPKFQSTSIFDEDTLKLKKDEIARICPIGSGEGEVTMLPCHYVGLNTGEDKSGWDKRSGYYACLGNYMKIFGDDQNPGTGADPDNCPYCKHGFKGGRIGNCVRRFGMDVLKYLTLPNGALREIGAAVAFDVLPWIFSGKPFNRLLEIKEQYGPQINDDLRRIDLMLKCESAQYQNFQIDPVAPNLTAWLCRGEDFMKLVWAQYKQNQHKAEEFEQLMGRRSDKNQAEQLCVAALGIGGQAAASVIAPVQTLSDVQSLLDNKPPTTPTGGGIPNLFAPQTPAPVATPAPPAPTMPAGFTPPPTPPQTFVAPSAPAPTPPPTVAQPVAPAPPVNTPPPPVFTPSPTTAQTAPAQPAFADFSQLLDIKKPS